MAGTLPPPEVLGKDAFVAVPEQMTLAYTPQYLQKNWQFYSNKCSYFIMASPAANGTSLLVLSCAQGQAHMAPSAWDN